MTFYRYGVILEYVGRGAGFMSKRPDMSGMDEGFGKESLPKKNRPVSVCSGHTVKSCMTVIFE